MGIRLRHWCLTPGLRAFLLMLLAFASCRTLQAAEEAIPLTLRSRTVSSELSASPDSPGLPAPGLPAPGLPAPEVEQMRFQSVSWPAKRTAVIVCDMWDLHTSRNATLRTGELAPVINRFVEEARSRGATIIHCPSDTMSHYEEHPARQAALKVPRSEKLPADIDRWCYQIAPEADFSYPLDQTGSTQDDDPKLQEEWSASLIAKGRKARGPWISQHPAIPIREGDYLTDRGAEVWSILEAKHLDHVLFVGVHTNMCVLGRPFGLRRLASNGKQVALVRDLTDTMYDPNAWPYVSHFSGTDRIIAYIERTVCPTVTSDQLLGGTQFVFREDNRKRIVVLISEPEYQTERTLPDFIKRHLGQHFHVDILHGQGAETNEFPGIEALKDADLLVISVRRKALPKEQFEIVRNYLKSGKPVVGIRTASHAFSLRGKQPPEGHEVWDEFDAEIFGGSYRNHFPVGPKTTISVVSEHADHPILTGTSFNGETSAGSLYQVRPLADSATALLDGKIEGQEPEPIAWTNTTRSGGKAFYTSLGHPSDFDNADFRRMLFNALFWATGQKVPESMPTSPEMKEAAPAR